MIVAVGAAQAQVTSPLMNFSVFGSGTLLSPTPVRIGDLTGTRTQGRFSFSYNNGSGPVSETNETKIAGTLPMRVTNAPSLFNPSKSINFYCITPEVNLNQNRDYLVFSMTSYAGISDTPPPTGAGFVKNSFTAYNPFQVLTTTFNANPVVDGAIRQSLLWHMAMSGTAAGATGISSIAGTGGVSNTFSSGYSTLQSSGTVATLTAGAQATAAGAKPPTFRLFVPVTNIGNSSNPKWAFDGNGSQNPASQMLISAEEPVPEPGTLALGAMGLLAAVRRRRARRA